MQYLILSAWAGYIINVKKFKNRKIIMNAAVEDRR